MADQTDRLMGIAMERMTWEESRESDETGKIDIGHRYDIKIQNI